MDSGELPGDWRKRIDRIRRPWGDATERVQDVILSRYRAGESEMALAADYGVTHADITSAITEAVVRERDGRRSVTSPAKEK